MKIYKFGLLLTGSLILGTSLNATLHSDKVTLKGNMVVEYKKLPASVDTLSELFSEGMVYGRLRSNIFLWDWTGDKTTDNKAMGIGGSLVYKTAKLSGFSATAGLYTSQNPSFFREDIQDVGNLKAGKDTLSRNNASLTGEYGMSVLGQAYLQYDISKSTIKAGRQTFESVFTASNDTKMIPNTFDGLTTNIKDIAAADFSFAYLKKQKLRDHTSSHDVIAYDPNNKWSENDDSASNKNLTTERIGSDNSLLISSFTSKSIKNLKTNISYAIVPSVVSNLVLEGHYTIEVDSWKIVPGARYMQQIDNLNADYDVASLKTTHVGYTNSKSLDSNLVALRLDIKNKAFLARIGYSKIADEADIVTPWRGFPTGGFTRAMAQYNWYANTKTYMLRAGYDFGKANIVEGFSVMARYAVQDFDDNKPAVQADSTVIHIDVRQNIGKNVEAKIRIGIVSADVGDTSKSDVSYNEYRFELNYLF